MLLSCLSLAPVCAQDAEEATPSSQRFDLVISTLKDIYVNIEKDSARNKATMTEFQAWCDAETGALSSSSQAAAMNYEQAFVTIREEMAQISNLEHAIAEIKDDTKDLQDAKAQLDNLRSEEAAKYTEEVGLNTESSRTVGKALGKLGSYSGAAGGAAFLQSMQNRFEPNRDYVAEVLKGIKDRLQQTRGQLDKVDQGKTLLHKSLAKAKQGQMDALGFEVLDKDHLLAKAKLDLVQARRIYDEQQESAADLTRMLTDTNQRCTTKASKMKVLQADQKREKRALAEAVAVLKTEKANFKDPSGATFLQGPTFLQMASKHGHSASDHASKAVRQLKVKKAVQLMLTQSKDKADGMRKAAEAVQGLIKAIDGHLKEAAARKRFCDVQIRLKKDAKETLEGQLSRINARQAFLSSDMGMLSTQVANLKQEAQNFLARLKQLEAVRSREMSDHEDATRDRQLTIKVVKKVKSIMQGFYNSPGSSSLIELGAADQSSNSTWKLGNSKQGTLGSSLMSMLETIVATFEKEQSDADKEKADAQQALLQLRQDTKLLIDRKTDEIAKFLTEKALAAQELSQVKAEDAVKSSSLATNEEAHSILDKNCADLLANYQALRQEHSEQISELKDVAEMLAVSK